MYLRACGSFKFANHENIGSANRKFEKVSHLRQVRNLSNYLGPANLRICDSRNLFAYRPPLVLYVQDPEKKSFYKEKGFFR